MLRCCPSSRARFTIIGRIRLDHSPMSLAFRLATATPDAFSLKLRSRAKFTERLREICGGKKGSRRVERTSGVLHKIFTIFSFYIKKFLIFFRMKISLLFIGLLEARWKGKHAKRKREKEMSISIFDRLSRSSRALQQFDCFQFRRLLANNLQ